MTCQSVCTCIKVLKEANWQPSFRKGKQVINKLNCNEEALLMDVNLTPHTLQRSAHVIGCFRNINKGDIITGPLELLDLKDRVTTGLWPTRSLK